MINGIGVLAWGVGGLEAESVMFGMPVMLKVPEVIGVRMTGALPDGTLATDLALTVTERLRKMRLSGKVCRVFRARRVHLVVRRARGRCQHGARIRGFVRVLSRRSSARSSICARPAAPNLISQLVEAYCKHQHLWFDPQAVPRYTEVIDIDLSRIETSIAGPHRPQDRLAPGATVAWLAGAAKPGSQRHAAAPIDRPESGGPPR